MMTETNSKPSATKVNLWVDLVLFIAILMVLAPNFTGLAIHEWLGLALAGGIVVHLLLHWDWVVATLRRFFSRMPASARFNLVLNTALFIDLVIITFTGIMISREALPLLGISVPGGMLWRGLHVTAANLSVFLAGLHVAVHWKWIANAIRKYVVMPLFGRGAKRPVPVIQPILHNEVK